MYFECIFKAINCTFSGQPIEKLKQIRICYEHFPERPELKTNHKYNMSLRYVLPKYHCQCHEINAGTSAEEAKSKAEPQGKILLSTHLNQVRKLEEELKLKNKQLEELKHLRETAGETTKELTDVKKKLEDTSQQLETSNGQLECLKQQVETSKARIKHLEGACCEASFEKEKLKVKSEALAKKLSDTQKRLYKANRQLTVFRSKQNRITVKVKREVKKDVDAKKDLKEKKAAASCTQDMSDSFIKMVNFIIMF